MASLAKWLSIRLRTKWFWVRVQLQSLFIIYCCIMDKLKPLQSFSFDGNVSEGWYLWLKHFESYLTATEKDRKVAKFKLQLY